ncbi:hypothetical protein B1H10_07620 [candidate division KSB1 bacterium 4484_188]|nr:MAG: hypothetical protein B1H10_07620 [candidate division KSB1 bacterium 4484_188]
MNFFFGSFSFLANFSALVLMLSRNLPKKSTDYENSISAFFGSLTPEGGAGMWVKEMNFLVATGQ